MIYFRKDLNFVKKILRLPEKLSKAADYFGGVNAVEKAIYESLTDRLFRLDLRNEEAYLQHAAAKASSLLQESRVFMELTQNVIEAYSQTRQGIHGIEIANRNNRPALDLCARLRKELEGLIPRDFLERYGPDRLVHLPRYLKAVELRAERGSYDMEKEQKKAAALSPFTEALRRNIKELSPRTTPEKREMLEEVFWMVEEFKVSHFAQELKTPFPVSEKRLEKKLRELERMI
jgi:ATP-dependent helicase HrpA